MGIDLPISPWSCGYPRAAQNVRYYHDDRDLHDVLPPTPYSVWEHPQNLILP